MSIDRRSVGRITVFVVSIALGGALMAQSAGQGMQQPPAQPTAKGGAPPGSQLDPSGVPLKPDATGPAPGTAAGAPTPVKFYLKVGPGGTVIGQDAPSSPAGPGKTMDVALERLGPGGAVSKPQNERLGPGGTVAQTQTSQPLWPGAATASEPPSERNGQQPAKKPGVTGGSGQAVNEPAAKGGLQVFIDPATGQIAEPTDAQLEELNQQNQAANVSLGQSDVVESPGLAGGMMVEIPPSLFPVVTATIGGDGKVTLEERQGTAQEAISHRPRVEQSRRSGNGQQLSPAGDLEQALQSQDLQRLGPAGDYQVDVPPADVTVTIVNLDGAGEGFNDATAVAAVFGNPGTTRGAQRLNVFRAAAEYWGAILKSPVPIIVDSRMDPQTCNATSAVLGSAGTTTAHRDFAGAPLASTWYVQAAANSRAGADLAAAQSDISATFNSDVDNPVCLGATSWWYGIGAPAPAGTIDFFTVVLHEIGHGIGVLTLVNLSTGAKAAGFDDAYERWLWDLTAGSGWPAMTNAQRVASAVNTGQVIFWGPRATAAARGLQSAGLNALYPRVYAPNPLQLGSSISHFDTVLTPNELMEPAITPPPGPYAYLTSGLLEDVGWKLLSNGIFNYGGSGTWAWNPTDGWIQPTAGFPSDLEPWNGNFVGVYGATWLWNGTSQTWSLLTSAIPNHLKACGNNLLWASAADGTWRWNAAAGWALLTSANPERLECFGGDAIWEGGVGTWIYRFGTGAWSLLSGSNPTAVLPCGPRLVWWQAGGGGSTWYWEAASGWHSVTGVGPESVACYRGQLAWEGAAGPGTWLFNFTTSAWTFLSANNPDQMLSWGPNLVWENAAFGTWVWDGGAWTQITASNATHIEDLGADLLWSGPGGTWVWSGGGGGTGWTLISPSAPIEIVSTGVVKY